MSGERRGGRPPKPAAERYRSPQVSFRLPAEDYQRLLALCREGEAAGLAARRLLLKTLKET